MACLRSPHSAAQLSLCFRAETGRVRPEANAPRAYVMLRALLKQPRLSRLASVSGLDGDDAVQAVLEKSWKRGVGVLFASSDQDRARFAYVALHGVLVDAVRLSVRRPRMVQVPLSLPAPELVIERKEREAFEDRVMATLRRWQPARDVLAGSTWSGVAREYGVPPSTMKRARDRVVAGVVARFAG